MPHHVVKDPASGGAEVGIIGLAVMGQSFARNLAGKGIKTAVYNRTPEVTEQFLKAHKSEQIIGSKTLKAFIQSVKTPRKIIMLVKAGPAVDEVIASLTPLLDKGDILIDFGNSHYHDTEHRAESLKEEGIHFWGCGISGGEKGALHGPSLMPGGPKETWTGLKPILEAAAAKDFGGKPCVTYLGPGSAGNYVKMVHNGIEYAIMQMMAETYEIMKTLLNMPAPSISQVFKNFDRGKLNGFLFELAAAVLNRKDDLGTGYLVDSIMDQAAQKGTGNWTAVDGLEKGIAIPTINEAVFSRVISSAKQLRTKLDHLYRRRPELENLDTDEFINLLDDALYVGVICAFAQGFELIQAASDENGWDTDPAEVARIWQGGCIIRTILLNTIEKGFRANGKETMHLLEMPEIISSVKGNVESLRQIVSTATKNAVPVPGLASALNYFYAITQAEGNANFIQALRDAFGAHTYERIDREGTFHTEWHKVE